DCTLLRDVTANLTQSQAGEIVAGVDCRLGEVLSFYPDERDGAGTACSRCVIYSWDEGGWYTDDTPRTDWIGQGIFPNPIAFGTDGMMYFQETDGTANGNPLSWSLTTGALDLGE